MIKDFCWSGVREETPVRQTVKNSPLVWHGMCMSVKYTGHKHPAVNTPQKKIPPPPTGGHQLPIAHQLGMGLSSHSPSLAGTLPSWFLCRSCAGSRSCGELCAQPGRVQKAAFHGTLPVVWLLHSLCPPFINSLSIVGEEAGPRRRLCNWAQTGTIPSTSNRSECFW